MPQHQDPCKLSPRPRPTTRSARRRCSLSASSAARTGRRANEPAFNRAVDEVRRGPASRSLADDDGAAAQPRGRGAEGESAFARAACQAGLDVVGEQFYRRLFETYSFRKLWPSSLPTMLGHMSCSIWRGRSDCLLEVNAPFSQKANLAWHWEAGHEAPLTTVVVDAGRPGVAGPEWSQAAILSRQRQDCHGRCRRPSARLAVRDGELLAVGTKAEVAKPRSCHADDRSARTDRHPRPDRFLTCTRREPPSASAPKSTGSAPRRSRKDWTASTRRR